VKNDRMLKKCTVICDFLGTFSAVLGSNKQTPTRKAHCYAVCQKVDFGNQFDGNTQQPKKNA